MAVIGQKRTSNITIVMNARALLACLDGSGSDVEWAAVSELRARADVCKLLLSHFRASSKWQVRASCVYHATRYAGSDENAFLLGVLATRDRSEVVRYRAAMLLAVAQRDSGIEPLRVMQSHYRKSAPDAAAAISAIEGRNRNLFVDRDGSGMTTLVVN